MRLSRFKFLKFAGLALVFTIEAATPSFAQAEDARFSPAASPSQASAPSLISEMVHAVRSGTSETTRQEIVARLKLRVDAMPAQDRLALVDEMLTLIKPVHQNAIQEIKAMRAPVVVYAIAGLVVMLSGNYSKRVSIAFVGGLMIVGALYVEMVHHDEDQVHVNTGALIYSLLEMKETLALQIRADELR